eukprot:TRINITY_DN93214_c0_g1_i1.p1 TRINITY_DN93214_c0_g1~~TRINITY_DN93214_c0_g1_i1.p1  ORF type:complete len:391 (+),score=36.73 TRINITY_DN93214_c0_g1_i1:44-1174(+)
MMDVCADPVSDEMSTSDEERLVTEGDHKCMRKSGRHVAALTVFLLVVPFLCLQLQAHINTTGGFKRWKPDDQQPWVPPSVLEQLKHQPLSFAAMAALIGLGRQQTLQASILVVLASLLILGGTWTATIIVTQEPAKTPKDFSQKGTISNVTQDVATPQGRLWSVSLGSASILLLTSMYTFWIYRSWAPCVGTDNPIVTSVLQYATERELRAFWASVPNVGFLLTAMIPSLSGVSGYERVLTAVHNVTAPISMLICVVMETIQLNYGENAFEYFFSFEPTPIYGPLTKFQRLRVVLLVECWCAGIVFVAVQGYLAFNENKRYWLALVSYFGEVIGLTLAFSLPAVAGIDNIVYGSRGTVTDEATTIAIEILNMTIKQ